MQVIVLIKLLALSSLAIVRADSSLWSLVDNAGCSFSQLRDGGERETKPVVLALFESFGVPLGPGQYGLLIHPAKPDVLDTMTHNLRTALSQDTGQFPLVKSLLADTESRHQVIATTENDYSHALHGMFMVVVNTLIRESLAFRQLVERYVDKNLRYPSGNDVSPTLGAQRSVQSVDGWFFPDWLVAFPKATKPATGETALNAKDVLSTVEFKMGGRNYDLIADLQDAFLAVQGIAVAKLSGSDVTYTLGIPNGGGGYTYDTANVKAALGSELKKNAKTISAYNSDLYKDSTTMLDRILEAAAIATWADTKLTLFAAGSRYFAAGPAAGYGLNVAAKRRPKQKSSVGTIPTRGLANDKSDEGSLPPRYDNDDDTTVDTVGDTGSHHALEQRQAIKSKALLPPSAADIDKVKTAAQTNIVNNIVYTQTYGTTLPTKNALASDRRPTFLAHVLALTMDKLRNSGGKRRLPTAGSSSKRPTIASGSTTDRAPVP